MKPLLSCTLLLILIFIISCFPSCTKETIKTVVKTDTVTVTIRTTDTLRTVFNDTSRLGLLTRKQWVLDTVLNSYTGPGTGTLMYARGGSNNVYNYDLVRSIYWVGGTQDAFDNTGTNHPYGWKFTNSDSTALSILNGNATIFHLKILKLDATHFTIYDSVNNILDVQIYKP